MKSKERTKGVYPSMAQPTTSKREEKGLKLLEFGSLS